MYKIYISFSTFLVILPVISTYTNHCLSPSQASCLIQEWLKVRSTSPFDPSFSGLLNRTVAKEANFEDETISYFTPPGGLTQVGPYAKSRAEYLQSRNAGESISTSTTPVFTLQSNIRGGGSRSSCDSLTLRWVSSAKIKVAIPQSTAKVGDPVVYKGIDFIIVDVQKAKILNVYTSADYIREIKQKGFPLEACPAK